jgi:membrane protein DedA with SNARE-associated domain
LITWISETGYLAIATPMFAENLFAPLRLELIMPVGGYAASRGELTLAGVVAVGWLGSIAGAFLRYGVGRWLGCERIRRFAAHHGAWLTMTPEDVDKANRWFCRHGGPRRPRRPSHSSGKDLHFRAGRIGQ